MGDASNYQVVLKAAIQKITEAELQKAVEGLSLKVKVALDPTQKQQLEQEVENIQKKATSSSGKSAPILDTKTTIDGLAIIKRRMEEIKASGGTNVVPTSFKDAKGSVFGGSITYADSTGQGVTETLKLLDAKGKVTKEISKAVDFSVQQTKETKKLSDINNNLVNTLGNNAKKVAEWAISTALIYGTLNEIRKATEFIISLNKELTSVQIVTGMDAGEVAKLSGEYNQLAKEMGATTLEVAKGNLEWFRQGKSVAEANELVKSSLTMSKLGNMESAQATEYLTSILNGFKLEAKDSIGVIDKLTQLDNNYATSVAEISSALQRSANSAQQAGVTFDELASYITVVSSVTRKSSDSIGESFPR